MQPNNPFGYGRYILTLVLAMCLRIAPWPSAFIPFNPDWVLLFLIYWVLASPERIGIFHCWIIGILVDVLTGRMLGHHALIYALVAYMCIRLHKRLRQFSLLQQGLFISFWLLLAQGITFWLENIQSSTHLKVSFWLPVLSGTLCWPFVYSLLRFIRLFRHYP